MPHREQTLRRATVRPATDGARKLNTLMWSGMAPMTAESKELRCHGCGKLLAEKAAPGKTRNEAGQDGQA